MLTLTETASTVVKTIIANESEAGQGGLRINADAVGGTQFTVAVTPAPETTDAVVEHDGARVFVGENAVTALDDKILDAQVGDDGSVRFAITEAA